MGEDDGAPKTGRAAVVPHLDELHPQSPRFQIAEMHRLTYEIALVEPGSERSRHHVSDRTIDDDQQLWKGCRIEGVEERHVEYIVDDL